MSSDRTSIIRWHENSARALEHMAANEELALRGDMLQAAAWHRRCADRLVELADKEDAQSFVGHPFRERWLEKLDQHAQHRASAASEPVNP